MEENESNSCNIISSDDNSDDHNDHSTTLGDVNHTNRVANDDNRRTLSHKRCYDSATTVLIDSVEKFEHHCSDLLQSIMEAEKEQQPVIYIDCEGINLSRSGHISTLQLCVPCQGGRELKSFVIDVLLVGDALLGQPESVLRRALESETVLKVIHDGRRDTEALYFQYDVSLRHVFDTQIAGHVLNDTRELLTRSAACPLVEFDLSMESVVKDPCWMAVVRISKLLSMLHFHSPSFDLMSVDAVIEAILKEMRGSVMYLPTDTYAQTGSSTIKRINKQGIDAVAQLIYDTAHARYDTDVIEALGSIAAAIFKRAADMNVGVTLLARLLICTKKEFEHLNDATNRDTMSSE